MTTLTLTLWENRSGHAAECIDLNDKRYASVLAIIEMKRQIPHLFDQLVPKVLSGPTPFTTTISFSVGDDKQPDNITVKTPSGQPLVDLAGMDAVKTAAPYRQKGTCYQISLTHTPPLTPPPVEKGVLINVDRTIKNQVMRLGPGDDTYFYDKTMEGQDIIDDESGEADILRFGQKKFEQVRWQALDGSDSDTNIDSLLLDFGGGNSVTIHHYFANNSTQVQNSLPGSGLIEKIQFGMSPPLQFTDVQALVKDLPVGQAKPIPAIRAGASNRPMSSGTPKTYRPSTGLSTFMPTRPKMITGQPGNSSTTQKQKSYTQLGSPSGVGGRPGIDAQGEPDFGPYIAEMQRRIRRNWAPPVADRHKHVVVFFKIARDGRLLEHRVQTSSGSPQADQAALSAVSLSAPFRPLPTNYKKQNIDVQFIFDYNVYGNGGVIKRTGTSPSRGGNAGNTTNTSAPSSSTPTRNQGSSSTSSTTIIKNSNSGPRPLSNP